MLYCSFCGKNIYEESTFCSSCGQKVIRVNEETEKPPDVLTVETVEKKSEKEIHVDNEPNPVPGDFYRVRAVEADGKKRDNKTQVQVSPADRKKLIPAIYSNEKAIVKYVIEMDGKRIEVVTDLGKKPKLELFVEGEPPEIINEQGTVVDFEFGGLSGRHTIEIWYSLASSSAFNVRYKETGVGIRIDGVPVKGTLADPLAGIKSGMTGLGLFAFILGIKFITSVVESAKESSNLSVAFVYLGATIAMIVFALLLKTRPKISLYGGLTIGLLEVAEYIVGIVITITSYLESYSSGSSSTGILVALLFWGSLRLWGLHSIWKATRALKRL